MTTGVLLVATLGLALALALGLGVAIAFLRRTKATDYRELKVLDELGAVVHVLERIAVILERREHRENEAQE
jgi:hypothetical protein